MIDNVESALDTLAADSSDEDEDEAEDIDTDFL